MTCVQIYIICFCFVVSSNGYSIITKQMLDNGLVSAATDVSDFSNGIKHFMKRDLQSSEESLENLKFPISETRTTPNKSNDTINPQITFWPIQSNSGAKSDDFLGRKTKEANKDRGIERKKFEAISTPNQNKCKDGKSRDVKDCSSDNFSESKIEKIEKSKRTDTANESSVSEATALEGPEILSKSGFTEREMEIFPTVKTPRNHASSSKSTRFNYFLDPHYNMKTEKFSRTIDQIIQDKDQGRGFSALDQSLFFGIKDSHKEPQLGVRHSMNNQRERNQQQQQKQQKQRQHRLHNHREKENRSLSAEQRQQAMEDNRNTGANSEKEVNDTLWQNMRDNILASLVSPSPDTNDWHRDRENNPLNHSPESPMDSPAPSTPSLPQAQSRNFSLSILQKDQSSIYSCKFHDYIFASNENCTFSHLISDLADELARVSPGQNYEERNLLGLENSSDDDLNTGRRKASLKYITFLLGILVVKLLVILPLVILTAGKSIALSLLSLGVATANVFQKHQMPYVKRRDEVPTFAYDKFALSPHPFR